MQMALANAARKKYGTFTTYGTMTIEVQLCVSLNRKWSTCGTMYLNIAEVK